VEIWNAPQTGTVNAIYYFNDRESVAQLARLPAHREAKGQVQRWYDGYRIIISEGDSHLRRRATSCPTVTCVVPSVGVLGSGGGETQLHFGAGWPPSEGSPARYAEAEAAPASC
jgi:hypothetical protein